jgi:hypothetical protein
VRERRNRDQSDQDAHLWKGRAAAGREQFFDRTQSPVLAPILNVFVAGR